MVPFLLAAVASDGSVTFDSNSPAATDFWIGPQRYGAAKVFGTEDAVAGTDTRVNGLRYTSDGVIRVYDATSAVPAGSTIIGGFAVTSDGQLCVSTDSVASATFVGGIAVRSDGAVFATGLSTPRSIADAIITALSPAAWYRNATDVVSSGGFASIWADYASSDKGLVLPGVVANYASTPDSVPLSIAGDETIIVRVNHTSNTGVQYWLSNYNSATAGSVIYTNASNTPNYVSAGTNAISVAASAAQPYGTGTAFWLKVTVDVDNGAAGSTVRFWTAADQATVPTSWTQLGTDKTTAGVHSRADSAVAWSAGGNSTGTNPFNGTIYRAIVKSGIDGTTVFDADFSAQAIGTASFTESSSNAATVTINTSGARPAHIGKARDLLQGTGTNQPAYAAGVFTFDGADNFMSVSYVSAQPRTRVFVLKQITWGTDHIFNSAASTNVGVHQNGSSPKIELYAGTSIPAGGNSNLAVDTYGILVGVFNGASSSLRINNSAKSSGNAGATNPTGLGVGGYVPGLSAFSNIAVLEIVDFPSALSDAEQDSVVTALANALSVTV